MPYLTVYRIEDAQRGGPYHRSGRRSFLFSKHGKAAAHRRPAPTDDGIPYEVINRSPWNSLDARVYGFRSIDALLEWFDNPDEWYYMHSKGFRVAVFEVDSSYCHFGQRQLCFLRSAARRLRDFPLTPSRLGHEAGRAVITYAHPTAALP